MALIGNYLRIADNPLRYFGGAIANSRSNFNSNGANRNQYTGAYFNYCSTPNGYYGRGAWIMSPKGGGLASYNQLAGSIRETNALLAKGRNIDASFSGSISISSADLDQIIDMIVNMSGSISTTSAILAAVASLQASLSGSISITNTQLGAIVDMIASMTANGLLSTNVLATAEISADIGGATPLSPEGLAQAMLDDYDIETGYSMRQALRLILSALAGKLSGAGTSTISIRDINDTVDRIIATVDANGNRSSITIEED